MKKIKMHQQLLTFEEGCNLYLLNCKKRNLRQGTINHYKQSYTQFYKYFDMEDPSQKEESALLDFFRSLVEKFKRIIDSITRFFRSIGETVPLAFTLRKPEFS